MAAAAAAAAGARPAAGGAGGGGAQDTIGWILRMILISWSVSTFMGFAQKSIMPDQSQLPRGADDGTGQAVEVAAQAAVSTYKGEIYNGGQAKSPVTGSFWIVGDDNTTRRPLKLPSGLRLGDFEAVELTQDINLTTCAMVNCTLYLAYKIAVDGDKFTYEGQTPMVFFERDSKRKLRRLLDSSSSDDADDNDQPDPAASKSEEEEPAPKEKRKEEKEGRAPDAPSTTTTTAPFNVADDDTVVWDINGVETVIHKDVVVATGAIIEPRKAKFQQRVTFAVVNDFRPWSQIPPQIHSLTSLTPDGRFYKPMIYVDNFWVLPSHRVEFNKSSTSVQSANFTIEFRPSSFWRTLMLTQWEISLNSVGTGEAEKMKKIFIETNPILLGVTMVVSILHLIFEYLAFSNDISFWKNKKDYKGLSLKTIALNCYFQTIIFLYLFDAEETSWTVLGPSAIGVLIEYWKLRKTVVVEKDPPEKGGRWKIHFKSSYDQRTRRHDDSAMRYLFIAMVPCMIGYTIYSALYEDHKGWYSFVIATQVRFIYLFGFVMMTPQIFVNYKMKSVTQLPWRTFVYKALNTFIDDLFAFIITMPTMHRLACFRDDIIFFILLYQRWIYKVDLTRTQQGSDEEEGEGEEEARRQQRLAPAQNPNGTVDGSPESKDGRPAIAAAPKADQAMPTEGGNNQQGEEKTKTEKDGLPTAATTAAAADNDDAKKTRSDDDDDAGLADKKGKAPAPKIAAAPAPKRRQKNAKRTD